MPDRILQETFISSLSIHEASIVMNALSLRGLTFTNSVKTELMSILSCHGCRAIPQPSTLVQLLVQASCYTFLIQSAAVLHIMNGGIPSKHLPFWKFLRFVTGSLVISVPNIDLINSLDSLGRWPVSHTCSAILELSSTMNSVLVCQDYTVISASALQIS